MVPPGYPMTANRIGFDHAETLARITCPALLVQADFSFLPDGTHVVHFAAPVLYVRILEESFGTDSP